jgi:hypothetical protein
MVWVSDLSALANEREVIDKLVGRLRQRFPDLPPERIVDAVTDAHREFSEAKVRDFVPVLVEQQVMTALKRGGRVPNADV